MGTRVGRCLAAMENAKYKESGGSVGVYGVSYGEFSQ